MLQPGSSFIALQVVCFKEQRIDVLKKKKQIEQRGQSTYIEMKMAEVHVYIIIGSSIY
jgi:predicted nucleic acid-binding Zn finger protein